MAHPAGGKTVPIRGQDGTSNRGVRQVPSSVAHPMKCTIIAPPKPKAPSGVLILITSRIQSGGTLGADVSTHALKNRVKGISNAGSLSVRL